MPQATLEQVKRDFRSLPPEQRARFLDEVEQEAVPEAEANLSPAWRAVINRRVEELRSGKVKGIPAEEVFAKMRRIIDAE